MGMERRGGEQEGGKATKQSPRKKVPERTNKGFAI